MATVTTPAGDVLRDVTGPVLDYYRGEGYTIAEDEAVDVVEGGYDPGKHTVDEVNTYLVDLDEPTRGQVFELERAGKARVGIIEGPFAVFDPADHTVDEVAAYLARPDIDDEERERVLEAERTGQARVGVLH